MVPEIQLQSADLEVVRCDPAEEQLVRPLWTGLLLQDRGPLDQLPGPGKSQAPKIHTCKDKHIVDNTETYCMYA